MLPQPKREMALALRDEVDAIFRREVKSLPAYAPLIAPRPTSYSGRRCADLIALRRLRQRNTDADVDGVVSELDLLQFGSAGSDGSDEYGGLLDVAHKNGRGIPRAALACK